MGQKTSSFAPTSHDNSSPHTTNDEVQTEDVGCGASSLIHDLWIDIFFFLNPKDFVSVCQTCGDFFKWTNKNKHQIQQYWKNKTKQLVGNMKPNYKSDDWKYTYLQIRQFLIDFEYINNDIFETNKPIIIDEKHFKIDDHIWSNPSLNIKDLSKFMMNISDIQRKNLWKRYSGKNIKKGIKLENISHLLYDLVVLYINNEQPNVEIPVHVKQMILFSLDFRIKMIKKQLKMNYKIKYNGKKKKRKKNENNYNYNYDNCKLMFDDWNNMCEIWLLFPNPIKALSDCLMFIPKNMYDDRNYFNHIRNSLPREFVVVTYPGALVAKTIDVISSHVNKSTNMVGCIPTGKIVTVEIINGRRAKISSPKVGWVSLYTVAGRVILQEKVEFNFFGPCCNCCFFWMCLVDFVGILLINVLQTFFCCITYICMIYAYRFGLG